MYIMRKILHNLWIFISQFYFFCFYTFFVIYVELFFRFCWNLPLLCSDSKVPDTWLNSSRAPAAAGSRQKMTHGWARGLMLHLTRDAFLNQCMLFLLQTSHWSMGLISSSFYSRDKTPAAHQFSFKFIGEDFSCPLRSVVVNALEFRHWALQQLPFPVLCKTKSSMWADPMQCYSSVRVIWGFLTFLHLRNLVASIDSLFLTRKKSFSFCNETSFFFFFLWIILIMTYLSKINLNKTPVQVFDVVFIEE